MDLTGRRVFLSGPVTGRSRVEAEAAFLAARKQVRSLGAEYVLVPTEIVAPGESHELAMLHCLRELLWVYGYQDGKWGTFPRYDMLVSLPGWKDSPGARVERAVAEACGIACRDLREVLADA